MAVESRTSQLRSFMFSSKSAVAKNLMPLAGGLPSGLSSLAATSAEMSWGWQFSTHAACSAVRRAGNWPSSIKNRCWSSFIHLTAALVHRHAADHATPFRVMRFKCDFPLVIHQRRPYPQQQSEVSRRYVTILTGLHQLPKRLYFS